MSEPETLAAFDLTCAECGRSPRAGETWRIYFADRVAREAVTYCPRSAPSGGVWQSPSGARVAWFKDPDGNILSITQP